MTSAKPDHSLDTIRREIDAIDQELLRLVLRRFEATGRVQAAKQGDGSLAASPLRPAREAQMFRRFVAESDGPVSPQFLVRLWRVILSASTQAQAPIVLHMHAAVASDMTHRLMLAEHFCGMGVESHDRLALVFSTLRDCKGDLAIVETASPWVEHFVPVAQDGIGIIASLPVLASGRIPALLVFGHAEAQPSGEDETILLRPSDSITPSTLKSRWMIESGGWTAASLNGFLSDELVSNRFPGCLIAGRLPCPIEVFS